MTNRTVFLGGVECHPCVYCGLPAETPGPGGKDHVCRHRDFFGGQGHRAHAICCANHLAGRDGIHGPCRTLHRDPLVGFEHPLALTLSRGL